MRKWKAIFATPVRWMNRKQRAGYTGFCLTFGNLNGRIRKNCFAKEKRKTMRVDQAKAIPLTRLLSALGHEPHHTKGQDVWYLSPFREETKPSFKVNTRFTSSWYDFGLGKGGNILDFVMQYYGLSGISEALAELDRIPGIRGSDAPLPLFPSESATAVDTAPANAPLTSVTPDSPPHSGITVKKVQALQNKALIQYLERRAIKPEVAREYVQEAYYTVAGRDRTYFAVAFKNDLGALELNNPYFKGVTGAKAVSTLSEGKNGDSVLVFEGFMDFLSILCDDPVMQVYPAIVLNSVALKEAAREQIGEMNVSRVALYLDNDASGRATTQWFREHLDGKTVTDQAVYYKDFKDVNAWFMNEKGLQSAR